MEDCIFCKIIAGDLPSSTVYEDDIVKVIMNINPSTNGHLLVLPKKHYLNIMDVEEEFITHSLKLIRENIYPLLKEKLKCKGLTIAENNELGQEIKHFHIHLTPRYEDDQLEYVYNKEIIKEVKEVFDQIMN